MNKPKKQVVIALLLGALTAGSISLNGHLDNQKFWKKAERGELYVTSFSMKQYKLLRKDLAIQMDEYLDGGEPLTYQSVQVYLAMISREAGKDSFKKDGKKIKGWELDDINNDNFLSKLNKRLKTKIDGE